MKHLALPCFWRCYRQLPKDVRRWQTRTTSCLPPTRGTRRLSSSGSARQDSSGRRVGMHHRALGFDKPEGIVWFWIGSHAEYDKLLSVR